MRLTGSFQTIACQGTSAVAASSICGSTWRVVAGSGADMGPMVSPAARVVHGPMVIGFLHEPRRRTRSRGGGIEHRLAHRPLRADDDRRGAGRRYGAASLCV